MPNRVGTLKETALHAALKAWYARPGDEAEVALEGFFIDLRRGRHLIEIQTRHFSAIQRKLRQLVERHPVRLVHPIARETWIVRVDRRGHALSRRKSPRRGRAEALFLELVSFPDLVAHPNFTLEILMTQEEEWRAPDRRRSSRVCDRRLLAVTEQIVFETPADFQRCLPADLPPFTSRELAQALDVPLYLAQKMTYCLRRMEVVRTAGKRRGAWLYELAP
jgi:hypothetical protein